MNNISKILFAAFLLIFIASSCGEKDLGDPISNKKSLSIFGDEPEKAPCDSILKENYIESVNSTGYQSNYQLYNVSLVSYGDDWGFYGSYSYYDKFYVYIPDEPPYNFTFKKYELTKNQCYGNKARLVQTYESYFSSYYWESQSGDLYVDITEDSITVSFCNIPTCESSNPDNTTTLTGRMSYKYN